MKVKKDSKVFIIGGHLTPALALVEYMREQGIVNIIWVGARYVQTGSKVESFEYSEVTKQNIPFVEFGTGKLWRKWTYKTMLYGLYNLLMIPLGFLSGLILLLRERPKLIIGFGGYIQVPLLFWAKFLKIPSAIHEQTVTIGTANKRSIPLVDKIFVSWKDSLKNFPAEKTILSGNPIRKLILDPLVLDYKIFNNNKPIILVTGGNQGSNTINWRLLTFLPDLLVKANVIHQVGNSEVTGDLEKAQDIAINLPDDLRHSYKYFSGDFSSEFTKYLKTADLIVCRAGANTVSEILALEKLAILIPIPWSSQEEQLKNAELVAKTGLGYIIKQYDAMPPSELFQAIDFALGQIEKGLDFLGRDIKEAKKSTKETLILNASEIIVNTLFEI
jgi:UDP-N-acetylglucosamine--N-acetylmuramyl-(pentapeptide) pyrophosphoryl-undecaprenol N-acetylglucosamine transferase